MGGYCGTVNELGEGIHMKKIQLYVIIVASALFITACGGSGLSENEAYLSYFDGRDSLAGIVIDGDFYELPHRFGDFIDSGWEVHETSFLVQNITDLGSVALPLEHRMEFQISRNGLNLTLRVINPIDEDINLMEALVVYISSQSDREDGIVLYGGVRIGTTARGAEMALENFNFSDRNTGWAASSDLGYEVVLNLSSGGSGREVARFTLMLEGQYAYNSFSRFRAPDVISAASFMEQSTSLTGTVVGTAEMQGGVEFDSGSSISVPLGEVILVVDDTDTLFAIGISPFRVDTSSNFQIENIIIGEEITAFSNLDMGNVDTDDGGSIPMMTNAQVLVFRGNVYTASSGIIVIE